MHDCAAQSQSFLLLSVGVVALQDPLGPAGHQASLLQPQHTLCAAVAVQYSIKSNRIISVYLLYGVIIMFIKFYLIKFVSYPYLSICDIFGQQWFYYQLYWIAGLR